MVIQIERPVRVTLLDAEVQTLKAGEIYAVSPAIGRVLVSDGWARELEGMTGTAAADPEETANDDPRELH